MLINILNGFFFIAYLLSALVQYNDPDALVWIIIYLTAAWMCLALYRNKLPRWLPSLLLLISLVGIGLLLPNIVGQVAWIDIFDSVTMKTIAVEEAREIGGLALIVLWTSVLVFISRTIKRGTKAD